MSAASLPTGARALMSLGAMTATVAHELRNLLGGVELYATLVAEQCAADPALAPLTGRLLIYDGLQAATRVVGIVGDPGCAVCGSKSRTSPG